MSQESRNGERKPFAYYNPATMTFHRDGEMTREQRERFMPLYAEKSPRSETGDSADARNKERRAIRECIELAQEANALRKALSGRGADEAEMKGDKSGPLPGVGTGTRTPTSAPLSSDASITDPNNKALIGKKENVSITPRTDGLMVSLLNTDSTEQQKAESLIDLARQLERELAEAKAALSVATSDAGHASGLWPSHDGENCERNGRKEWLN